VLAGLVFLTSACGAMQAPAPAAMVMRVPAGLRLVAPAALPRAALALRPDAAATPVVAVMLPPPTDAASLRLRYGMPDFVRQEGESELWRYDGADCAAFFFLYREGGSLKLRYSETMPRGKEMPADSACVESLSEHAGAMS
jgi:hypothetical protein